MTDLSFINAANDASTDPFINAILDDDSAWNASRDGLANSMLSLFATETLDLPDILRSMLLGETIGVIVATFANAMADDAKLEAFRALITERAGILDTPDLTQNPLLTAVDPAAEGARLAKIITDAVTDEGMLGVIAATLVNSIIAEHPHLRGPLKTLIDGAFDDAPLPA